MLQKKERYIYKYKEEYYVEITEEEECNEFWLCNKRYGIKMLMYGLTKETPIKQVLKTLPNYIESYIEDYKEDVII